MWGYDVGGDDDDCGVVGQIVTIEKVIKAQCTCAHCALAVISCRNNIIACCCCLPFFSSSVVGVRAATLFPTAFISLQRRRKRKMRTEKTTNELLKSQCRRVCVLGYVCIFMLFFLYNQKDSI